MAIPPLFKNRGFLATRLMTTSTPTSNNSHQTSEEDTTNLIKTKKIVVSPFKGKHHNEESKRKLSESRKNIVGEKHPMFGKHHSEETKVKISNALINKHLNGWMPKPPFMGHHHSEEAKHRISESLKGRPSKKKGIPLTEEVKQKISKSQKGKPSWIRGKHHRPETIEKLRIALKGKNTYPRSEKTKKRLRLLHIGKKLTPEHRLKISQSLMKRTDRPFLGKHHSEEAKHRISESLKGDKNHNWRGGLSFEPYTTDWNETLRRSIRERDHYTCQLCSKQQCDIAFDVHHIDYNKKNCNPENLITLCRLCHGKTVANRDFWTNHLMQLIVAGGVAQ